MEHPGMRLDPHNIKAIIRDIPDWPSPGIMFRDITPLIGDGAMFGAVVDAMAEHFSGRLVDAVVGVEARGFIFGAPVAHALGVGFVPVRKSGKLPHEVEVEEYQLEYGADHLEIHSDALTVASSVVVVDDVLATGGTAAATVRLIERLGGTVTGLAFVAELLSLGGRAQLPTHEIHSLVTYE